MKVSRNKVILIVLIVIMLGGTIIYKIVSNKSEENVKENKKCDEKNFFLGDYSYDYDLEKEDNYFLVTSKKEYQAKKELVEFSDEEKLDFENHDYLIYILPAQHGCDRSYRLNCFEQRDKEVYLNFDKNEADQMCDAIFFDSIIIELEKDKYDNKLEVKTNI
ncbi:MAG: hypothetical protein IJN90_06085 [Bacilli bacterium]|nr:hypothetical protein [Bacilli bacterium]